MTHTPKSAEKRGKYVCFNCGRRASKRTRSQSTALNNSDERCPLFLPVSSNPPKKTDPHMHGGGLTHTHTHQHNTTVPNCDKAYKSPLYTVVLYIQAEKEKEGKEGGKKMMEKKRGWREESREERERVRSGERTHARPGLPFFPFFPLQLSFPSSRIFV